jgi:hypothetical protein
VSGNTPTSPAQWLYGLLRALPGGAGLLSPSPCEKLLARLSASIAAPGPHDLAVRFGVFVRREKAPDAKASITSPAQRIVTIAKRPLVWAGMRKIKSVICPTWKAEYF